MTEPFTRPDSVKIAIIGGSGFYDLAEGLEEIKVETPYGSPSDKIAQGLMAGRQVAFLPRHGKSHGIPPHRINYRANLWALKSLGVEEIIATNACGSLQKEIKPGSVVVLDQFFDRTSGRSDTFFDGPIVTHVSTAYPYCSRLREAAIVSAQGNGVDYHSKGTVVVIQGPRFSTAAESLWFTQMGWHVVNMTQYPEVVLARELQMCYVGLAFPTDYDVGLVNLENLKPVSHKEVLRVFQENIGKAKNLVLTMIENLPAQGECGCRTALAGAR